MKPAKVKRIRTLALEMLENARIVVTPEEAKAMEVADLGLDDIENIGVEVVVYENNDRYCAKELILLPRQLCPEHRHPPIDRSNAGKQETFRCRWGEVFLYVPGEPTRKPRAEVPKRYRPHINVWHEIVLRPGDQFTLPPNTLHWFQAGDEGAILSEFSSTSSDENDVFTDPDIRRVPPAD